MDPTDGTQVVRFGSKRSYVLSQLAGPFLLTYFEMCLEIRNVIMPYNLTLRFNNYPRPMKLYFICLFHLSFCCCSRK